MGLGIIPDQIPGTALSSQSSELSQSSEEEEVTLYVLGIRGFLLLGWKMENIAKWNA